MRKSTKLMAGLGVVAGLGVALAPLATFAVGDTAAGSNTLQLTINSNCAVDTSGNNGAISGTWSATTEAGDKDVDLAGASGYKGTVVFDCNENSKVKVYAAATALTGPETIPVTSVKAKYSAAQQNNGMTIQNGWDASSYKAFSVADQKELIAQGTAPASGDFGITVDGYKVTITADQQAGTYEGTVTYTFDNVASL